WEMAHPHFYGWKDTVTVNGRVVSNHPPGVAVLVIPLYSLWRVTVGPVDTPEEFQAFNAVLVLVVGETVSSLIVVQMLWLTGWPDRAAPSCSRRRAPWRQGRSPLLPGLHACGGSARRL